MQFRYGSTVISLNLPDRASVETAVAARLAAGQGFALATLNLDHMVKLAADPAFRAAYGAQDLVCADGNPVVWLSRLAGRPVELVPGSELVLPLARCAARAGVPVALFGSTEPVLQRAADVLRKAAPGLEVAACLAPPHGFDPQGQAAGEWLARLGQSGARLCFLALGAPKQEVLAARGRRELPQMGFVSVGAGLDFLAGRQTRAPRWMRRLALEWLWRMASDPRRLVPRYAACARILPGQLWAAWRQRRG